MRRRSLICLEQVCGLLADHEAGSVDVAGRNAGHDRSIGDSKTDDAPDSQPGVDNGVWTITHPAGADRMVDRPAAHASKAEQLLVRRTLVAGQVLAGDEPFERLRIEQRPRKAQPIDEKSAVVRVVEIVCDDARMLGGSADRIASQPRLLGRSGHTVSVMPGKSCKPLLGSSVLSGPNRN